MDFIRTRPGDNGYLCSRRPAKFRSKTGCENRKLLNIICRHQAVSSPESGEGRKRPPSGLSQVCPGRDAKVGAHPVYEEVIRVRSLSVSAELALAGKTGGGNDNA